VQGPCISEKLKRCSINRVVNTSTITTTMSPINLTLYSINGPPSIPSLLTFIAILILDSDGNRILAKYYNPPHLASQPPVSAGNYTTNPEPNPFPTVKEQKTFEKGLFDKTRKQSSDVILFDNKIVVYKQGVDCTMYVVGNAEENEVMLYLVVVALRDCLDALLKYFPLIPSITIIPLNTDTLFRDRADF
jgi:hypothetical protein